MNSSPDSLSKALRELAAASPKGAPPEVGVRLRSAFARHHSRRRRKRIAVITVLLACLLVSLAWWLRVGNPGTEAKQRPRIVQPAAAPPAVVTHATGAATAPRVVARPARTRIRSQATGKTYRTNKVAPSPVMAASDFVALPSFNPAIPIGPSRIVRVELPGSALQLVGYAVNGELLERRVVADVLVGQDGIPYALRLIQTLATIKER